MDNSIKDLRMGIDRLDDIILQALNKRYELCVKIGEEKKKLNCEVRDNNREEKIMSRLEEKEQYPNMVREIWPYIIDFSRNLQK